MPNMTAGAIIDAAYRKNGISDPTSAQDTAGLLDLQNMLSSWSVEGLTVPYYVTENFTLTSGQSVYTIGVTADTPDLVTATGRPLRIVNAFIRISNDDYRIDVNMTKDEYYRITSKDTESRPQRLYYDPQYPNGTIRFDVEADSAYDFHLVSEKPFVSPTATTTTFSLPQEVNMALIYNLAVILSHDTDNQLSPDVIAVAIQSKDNLEHYNAINKLNDAVTLDRAISPRGGYYMDIKTGGY